MKQTLWIFLMIAALAGCKPEGPPSRSEPAEPAKAELVFPAVRERAGLGQPLVDVHPDARRPQDVVHVDPVVAVDPTAVGEPAAYPAKKAARKVPPSIREPLPRAELDLSLPEELAKLAKPAAFEGPAAVLPPMFNERPSAYSLNGRILSQERQQDIDGAELRLEFRH